VNKSVAPKRVRLLAAEAELQVVTEQLAIAMGTLKEVRVMERQIERGKQIESFLLTIFFG
jgi:flagella basal body P-ring formation protein FlgA